MAHENKYYVCQQMVSRRVNHAVRYPVNCDPVDGVSPNLHAMQVNRTTCPRCLQGEPVSITCQDYFINHLPYTERSGKLHFQYCHQQLIICHFEVENMYQSGLYEHFSSCMINGITYSMVVLNLTDDNQPFLTGSLSTHSGEVTLFYPSCPQVPALS